MSGKVYVFTIRFVDKEYKKEEVILERRMTLVSSAFLMLAKMFEDAESLIDNGYIAVEIKYREEKDNGG